MFFSDASHVFGCVLRIIIEFPRSFWHVLGNNYASSLLDCWRFVGAFLVFPFPDLPFRTQSLLPHSLSYRSPLCNLLLRDPRDLFVFIINFFNRRNSHFRFPSASFKLFPVFFMRNFYVRHRRSATASISPAFFKYLFPFRFVNRCWWIRAFNTLVILHSNKMHIRRKSTIYTAHADANGCPYRWPRCLINRVLCRCCLV